MFVEDAIDFEMAWEPTLEANAVVISSFVLTLLSAFPVPASICNMAVNVAIGALTFVAVSGSTASTASTASTVSTVSTVSTASYVSTTSTMPTASVLATVSATLSEKSSPPGCISKFFGKGVLGVLL